MTAGKVNPIEERVLNFIKRQALVRTGQKLLVAVSGGADSVCLLYVLNKLQAELNISLHVAHLNHQLRGREAEDDAAFVEELAGRLGLPVTIGLGEVEAYQNLHHLTLEEAAREVRYAFLAETARAVKADSAAVGHTQNDQVETVLLHIIRGTGTLGLQGLHPSHVLRFSDCSLTVIRPLLDVTRPEIEEYCRLNGAAFRQDSSNSSRAILRNRVRLELLPLLSEYNSDIAGSLLRISRIARDETAYLEAETARLWNELAAQKGSNVLVDKKAFLAQPPAMQRQLLRRSIALLLGTLKDIETRHIEAVMEALSRPAGRKINLPAGIVFSIEYDRFILGRDIQSLAPFAELPAETRLQVPGLTVLPGWAIESRILPAAESLSLDPESRQNWQNDGFGADFDLASTGDRLTVRGLRPGDYFQPLGLAKPKKVARFMLDARIPHDWRSRVPLVCNPQQVIWVTGWRIDERVKITSSTQSVLRIRLTRK